MTFTLHPSLVPGQRWGDFELMEQLGSGGTGTVFRARQLSLGREVALKVLMAAQDEACRKSFQAEAQALARIDSPNVVKVHFIGEQAGHPYFVMEYIAGQDLEARLQAGWRPSQDEAVEIILQIARGLLAASACGLCHRDIKPANIMIGNSGVIKLTDFGLVGRIASHDTTVSTLMGAITGTALYLSPEQGSGLRGDHRSDIYSLGVVFYQLITGRPPFEAATPLSLIYHHIHSEPLHPRRLDARIDLRYDAVVMKCLRKSPAQRYQAIQNLITDLEGARRRLRQHSLLLMTGIAAAVVLVMVSTLLLVRHARQARLTAQPPAPPRTLTVAPTALSAIAVASSPMHAPASPPGFSAVTRDQYGWTSTLSVSGVAYRFRWCPPGSFLMGSPTYASDHRRDEALHRVTLLNGFWLAESECPRGLWLAVLGGKSNTPDSLSLPVTDVAREQCERFCELLATHFPGLTVRLPWEAEWEYACKSGGADQMVSARTLGPAQACFDTAGPRQVGISLPSAWGLRDMLGNVSEWCLDHYQSYPPGTVVDPRPAGTSEGVARGGCFEDAPADCNAARRFTIWSHYSSPSVGFRILVEAAPRSTPRR